LKPPPHTRPTKFAGWFAGVDTIKTPSLLIHMTFEPSAAFRIRIGSNGSLMTKPLHASAKVSLGHKVIMATPKTRNDFTIFMILLSPG